MLRTENSRRMVIVAGIVLVHHAVGDRIRGPCAGRDGRARLRGS